MILDIVWFIKLSVLAVLGLLTTTFSAKAFVTDT